MTKYIIRSKGGLTVARIQELVEIGVLITWGPEDRAQKFDSMLEAVLVLIGMSFAYDNIDFHDYEVVPV